MKKLNDAVSSISHFFGAIVSIPISLVLVGVGAYFGNAWYAVSFAIFGLSLFMLYSASTIYHLIPSKVGTEGIKLVARKIDHMMIFVLIAGSYTPVCLITLRGVWGYTMITIIWVIAFLGIVFKSFGVSDNKLVRNISTGLYLLMGWIAIIAIVPLINAMSTLSFVLLCLGGLSYTVGAVIYAVKKPTIKVEWLDFHDVFHFFVLLGSTFHIIMMFTLL
ncbi:MAG: PAQR family membrane homeostasis protein TrhA [Lachnospirales bacterium]